MRDVIVVGAGPAGCWVAKELADRGRDVAVYEKRQEIGAPKRCGEGLSSSSIQELDLHPPKECKRKAIQGAVVYSPNLDSVEIDFGKTVGWILERKFFDKWLAQRAAEAGASVRAKTRVTQLLPENKGVSGLKEGEEFEEKAQLVVAADGVESLIAREAGIKSASQLQLVDSGYQYELANLDLENPDRVELYFGEKVAPRGYAWVFPKGASTANVGVGIGGDQERPAKYYLDKFIQENGRLNQGSILEVNSGMIPVGGFLKDMVTDNCLAVGDAANQVNPIHGGGMAEGIRAGKIAAGVIHSALEEGDTSSQNLQEYNEKWWSRRGESLKKIEKLREVIEELKEDDLNYLAEELEGEDLVDLAEGRGLSKLGKLLLKRPGLIKLGRKLI